MFDAARAALLAVGHDVGRTHRGVLNAFNDRLVKGGAMPREAGRLLKHAETFRYVADYSDNAVDLADARTMVDQAEETVRGGCSIGRWSEPDPGGGRAGRSSPAWQRAATVGTDHPFTTLLMAAEERRGWPAFADHDGG